jgi:apolipoprotein D and lipocalin family protein
LGRYDQRFEHDCENVSADYALRSDGLINIINTCRDARGRIRRVSTGRARLIPKSGGAKLKVSFFGPLFVGNYWILDRDDDYRWSIVGEPSGRYLWILSRDPVPPAELYASLLGRAQAMGFAMRQFRRTDQSAARSVGAG